MHKLLLIGLLLLTSCAQLMQGAEQPVVQYRDTKTFKTTCGGAAEDWGSCYRKANRTCGIGYEVIDRSADSNGLVRQLIFSCK